MTASKYITQYVSSTTYILGSLSSIHLLLLFPLFKKLGVIMKLSWVACCFQGAAG